MAQRPLEYRHELSKIRFNEFAFGVARIPRLFDFQDIQINTVLAKSENLGKSTS